MLWEDGIFYFFSPFCLSSYSDLKLLLEISNLKRLCKSTGSCCVIANDGPLSVRAVHHVLLPVL